MSEAELGRCHQRPPQGPRRPRGTRWRTGATARRRASGQRVHRSHLVGGRLRRQLRPGQLLGGEVGIVGLSTVVAMEGARYGVRSNAVSPSGRTRLALRPPARKRVQAAHPNAFDPLDPANVSPLIGWLAEHIAQRTPRYSISAATRFLVMSMPPIVHSVKTKGSMGPSGGARLPEPAGSVPLDLPGGAGVRLFSDGAQSPRQGAGAGSGTHAGGGVVREPGRTRRHDLREKNQATRTHT